ncbi:MAG: hypothetical protein DSY98_07925, partial [SAR324 cluster bacterium]
GHVKIRDHIVEMTNTSAVDNMLYCFHMLQMYRADIHASFVKTRQEVGSWMNISDQEYLRQRNRVLGVT